MTNYKGIDYGLGQSNIDKETGIRYGIIPQNDVMPEALDDVFSHGRDLGYEYAEKELHDKLRGVLEDYFSDYKRGTKGDGMNDGKSRLDIAVEDCFNNLDGWADNIESSGPYFYESEETVQTDEGGDLWVFKSPFFTYAQYCSPCAPGACYLANPLYVDADRKEVHQLCKDFNVPKAYCLGHEWFEGGKAPYPVYSVETGERIDPKS